MNLLLLATLVLLIVGFFNPQTSLFWYRQQRTRALSAIVYGVLFVLLICIKSANENDSPNVNTQSVKSDSTTAAAPSEAADPAPVTEAPEKLEADRITEKLKLKAARDWPNDYTTQEYWINQELEDYKYMRTIPAGPIKRQAERDWPYDYSTQKYWYNEQIEAKQRLNK